MTAGKLLTVDEFMALDEPVELLNLAAVLGTERDDAGETVWAGENFGSALHELLGRPGSTLATELEIRRVLADVGLHGEVAAAVDAADVRVLDVDLAIDARGVTLAAD